jgi:hypothetical protein
MTVLNLGAWIVSGCSGSWTATSFGDTLRYSPAWSALFAVFSYRVPRRRPGYADRLFGEAYRTRRDASRIYDAPLATRVGAIGAAEMITAIDFAHAANLLISCLICGLVLMFLGLRPVAPANDAIRSGAFFSEGRS